MTNSNAAVAAPGSEQEDAGRMWDACATDHIARQLWLRRCGSRWERRVYNGKEKRLSDYCACWYPASQVPIRGAAERHSRYFKRLPRACFFSNVDQSYRLCEVWSMIWSKPSKKWRCHYWRDCLMIHALGTCHSKLPFTLMLGMVSTLRKRYRPPFSKRRGYLSKR